MSVGAEERESLPVWLLLWSKKRSVTVSNRAGGFSLPAREGRRKESIVVATSLLHFSDHAAAAV